ARAPLAVGPWPHVVARLRGDHELVAVGSQIVREQTPEVLLGRAVGRSVVVGEVEVGDAEVECAPHDGALGLEWEVVAEVVPEAEREHRHLNPAAPRPAVLHLLVAIVCGHVGHRTLPMVEGTGCLAASITARLIRAVESSHQATVMASPRPTRLAAPRRPSQALARACLVSPRPS